MDFTNIPGQGFFFYNDELDLKNDVRYFVKAKLVDALNRTKIGVSDGITVKMQLPTKGSVRDGLDSNDIDYQESTAVISANWDAFGDELSNDPTQEIHHYEVSVGDDTKDHTTRTNIHHFTNVGLNKNFTFTGLNLTPKAVLYYVTVRGYSITGAFEESYSNGLRVGYRLDIIPGTVEVNEFQSSKSEISVSWTKFKSDIGIREYILTISTDDIPQSNTTFSCTNIQHFTTLFDVVHYVTVGLDTYITLENLTLNHGVSYYITVIASDEAGRCFSSKSKSTVIDMSPPVDRKVRFIINGRDINKLKQFYVTDLNEIEIQLFGLEDPESEINIISFRLYEYLNCPTFSKDVLAVHEEIEAFKDPKVKMKDLGLQPHRYYFIAVTVSNNAGLKTQFNSSVMLLDTSAPYAGSAKIGIDWVQETLYQSSTSTIEVLTAIAMTEKAYYCDNTRTVFPSGDESAWSILSGNFSPESVSKDNENYILYIGYNIPLTEVIKSGIARSMEELHEGSFVLVLSAAKGNNISTSVIISTSKENPFFPKTFTRPTPYSTYSDFVNFNMSQLENVHKTFSDTLNTTSPLTLTELITPPVPIIVNHTETTYDGDMALGFGFQILGDQQQGSVDWDCLFWAKGVYGEVHKWVQIKKNPYVSQLQYSIKIAKKTFNSKSILDLKFSIDGVEKANINGLIIDEQNLTIFVHTWNFNEFQEPLKDPLNPFRSKATFSNLKIPSKKAMDCIYGSGFYDGESGIAEIWTGVSDNINTPGNIREFELYQIMCTPCSLNCNFSCDDNCSFSDNKFEEFKIIKIKLDGLNLTPTILSNERLNANVHTEIQNMTQYYVNVQMVNLAGQPVTSITNPVVIDLTPPVCEYVECVDPVFTGMDTPTQTLGSNKTVGAYWSCDDNISGIKRIFIKVGTGKEDIGNREDENKFAQKYIGSVSKVRIDLDDNIYFDDRTTYFVNILMYNGAGLSAVYSCNVTTILSPPNVSSIDLEIMHSAVYKNETSVVLMDSQTRFGLKWNNKQNDTVFYSKFNFNLSFIFDCTCQKWYCNYHIHVYLNFSEWQMGTYEGSADIIPPTIIGLTRKGMAQVLDGELWLDSNNTEESFIAVVPNTWNILPTEMNKTHDDFRFLMEPGRCVYLSLIAVGYSNLEANVSSRHICFKSK